MLNNPITFSKLGVGFNLLEARIEVRHCGEIKGDEQSIID
jgi:hypothetical protein